MMRCELTPSILSCDAACVAPAVEQMMRAGADWIHLDVMDGQFVPPITLGHELARSLAALGTVPLEAHLMTLTPERHFDAFIEAGCKRVTFHAEAAPHAALMGRFSRPAQPFHPDWVQERPWSAKPWATAVAEFLDLLDVASELSAADLPAHLRQIIARFPDLRSGPAPDLPAYGRLQADALGRILLGEAGLGSQGICPNETAALQFRRYTREAPEAEALRLAGSLRPHFEAGPGHIEVAAPGRIDRHALARGDPLPFRMRLPGKALPAPQIVLCLDISGSMAGRKLSMARVAGQAIALAVAAQGGEVVGVLFSDAAQTAVAGSPSPLFAPLREWTPMGGTSFFFLPHVWRQWPEHRVLLLTDGYATPPPTLPADRQRTAAVLILEGNYSTLAGMAGQTVRLADLKDLPTLLAMLIPRRRA